MYFDTSKMIIIDLYSGEYNRTNVGHETHNLRKDQIDNKYYGYCPPLDGIAINNFGAKSTDDHIDGIFVIYVTKKNGSNNREIIAFCSNATVFKKGQHDKDDLRHFTDKDGSDKIATYSIVSDNLIDLRPYTNKFEIIIKNYSIRMFRKQRVYGGKYPKLDKDIQSYLKTFFIDNDVNQDEIQDSEPADKHEIKDSSNKRPNIVYSGQGSIIEKDARISKAALFEANYKCIIDPQHKTFLTKRNVQYMEGHHLIPCTVANSENFYGRFKKNIDCFENIVSLCPNCHRELHYGEWNSKSEKIKLLYKVFYNKLKDVGILIKEDELLSLYK